MCPSHIFVLDLVTLISDEEYKLWFLPLRSKITSIKQHHDKHQCTSLSHSLYLYILECPFWADNYRHWSGQVCFHPVPFCKPHLITCFSCLHHLWFTHCQEVFSILRIYLHIHHGHRQNNNPKQSALAGHSKQFPALMELQVGKCLLNVKTLGYSLRLV